MNFPKWSLGFTLAAVLATLVAGCATRSTYDYPAASPATGVPVTAPGGGVSGGTGG